MVLKSKVKTGTTSGLLYLGVSPLIRPRNCNLGLIVRLHSTASKRNRMNPDFSKFCDKHKIEEGSHVHCLLDCVRNSIHKCWEDVGKEMNDIIGQALNTSPLFCILGIETILQIFLVIRSNFLKILLFCARRCILFKRVSEEPPSVAQWIRSVLEFMPLGALSFYLRPFQFYKVWGPFTTDCLRTTAVLD